jgi:hypothetical protein
MMLLRVKAYLQSVGQASLGEIALHVCQSPETTRALLARWMHKGKVGRRPLSDQCGTLCQRCRPAQAEVYAWLAPLTDQRPSKAHHERAALLCGFRAKGNGK